MRDLTNAEQGVLDMLGGTAATFASLPPSHSSDLEEFKRAIHAAQNIVLARPATEAQQRAAQDALG